MTEAASSAIGGATAAATTAAATAASVAGLLPVYATYDIAVGAQLERDRRATLEKNEKTLINNSAGYERFVAALNANLEDTGAKPFKITPEDAQAYLKVVEALKNIKANTLPEQRLAFVRSVILQIPQTLLGVITTGLGLGHIALGLGGVAGPIASILAGTANAAQGILEAERSKKVKENLKNAIRNAETILEEKKITSPLLKQATRAHINSMKNGTKVAQNKFEHGVFRAVAGATNAAASIGTVAAVGIGATATAATTAATGGIAGLALGGAGALAAAIYGFTVLRKQLDARRFKLKARREEEAAKAFDKLLLDEASDISASATVRKMAAFTGQRKAKLHVAPINRKEEKRLKYSVDEKVDVEFNIGENIFIAMQLVAHYLQLLIDNPKSRKGRDALRYLYMTKMNPYVIQAVMVQASHQTTKEAQEKCIAAGIKSHLLNGATRKELKREEGETKKVTVLYKLMFKALQNRLEAILDEQLPVRPQALAADQLVAQNEDGLVVESSDEVDTDSAFDAVSNKPQQSSQAPGNIDELQRIGLQALNFLDRTPDMPFSEFMKKFGSKLIIDNGPALLASIICYHNERYPGMSSFTLDNVAGFYRAVKADAENPEMSDGPQSDALIDESWLLGESLELLELFNSTAE